MSDTPETDAEVSAIKAVVKDDCIIDVITDFARKLERERDEAREAFAIATDHSVVAQCKLREAIIERDEARAVSKYWQEQFGHSVQEHEWQSFPWEAAK